MATEVHASSGAMSQLQSIQKVMALPTVGAAVGQVGAFYSRVKGAHSLLEWALSTAEASVSLAAATAAPYVAAPLAAGDARVAAVIEELERRVPIMTEEPKVIIETTKQAVLSKLTPQINKVYGAREVAGQRVKSLKELTWTKANVLLSTAYGQKAVHGVDAGAMYAMRLLDQYLPPTKEEANAAPSEVVPMELDPATHAVQTVGRLSAAAARRVWGSLAARVNELRAEGIELDFRRYITALLAALHLAKVTSDQQQQEKKPEEHIQQAAEPKSANNLSKTHDTAPTTVEKVKSTPEAKSNGDE